MTVQHIPCQINNDDLDGFVAFVDAPAYSGFVDEDWELPDLVSLFSERSREGVLAIQYVGQEASWASLDVRAEPSRRQAVSEVSLPLTVTNGRVWVTSYTALTMVAQFEDELLINQQDTEPVLELDNGSYILTFRWFPLNDSAERQPAELVVTPGIAPAPATFPGGEELLGL